MRPPDAFMQGKSKPCGRVCTPETPIANVQPKGLCRGCTCIRLFASIFFCIQASVLARPSINPSVPEICEQPLQEGRQSLQPISPICPSWGVALCCASSALRVANAHRLFLVLRPLPLLAPPPDMTPATTGYRQHTSTGGAAYYTTSPATSAATSTRDARISEASTRDARISEASNVDMRTGVIDLGGPSWDGDVYSRHVRYTGMRCDWCDQERIRRHVMHDAVVA